MFREEGGNSCRSTWQGQQMTRRKLVMGQRSQEEASNFTM
jgi:hypothetical protein